MNYTVRAVRVYSINGNTKLEDYKKNVANYVDAEREEERLQSTGQYSNITINKIRKPSN